MCSIPAARIRDSWCSRNGTPAVGNMGLGADRVSGRSRVPLPPTRTTASTSVRAICCLSLDVRGPAGLLRSAGGAGRSGDRQYVFTVGGFGQRLPQGQALVSGDEPVDQRNLLKAGDADALAVFKNTYEFTGVQQ